MAHKNMVVGLTGGTATGKSLVSRELFRLGAAVIDADLIAREVLAPGTPAYEETVRAFGKEILLAGGEVDRAALGRIVFSDPEKLALLNGITHPRIRDIIRKRVAELKEKGAGLIVVDAALLIETGLYREMDKVVVVYAGEGEQIKRLMKRDGLDEAGAFARIRAQMPVEQKKRYADFVIDNTGAVSETKAAVKRLYSTLVPA